MSELVYGLILWGGVFAIALWEDWYLRQPPPPSERDWYRKDAGGD